ncbi:MAG TPA: substrate-binding domain-containing protein [Conexibacter sp.]
MRAPRGLLALVAAVALVAVGAGCGSSDSDSGTASTTASKGKDLRIEYISHAPTSDSFWIVGAMGARAAGEDLGVTVNYRGPQTTFDAPEQKRLLQQAIASKPDGIVVTVPDVSVLEPVVKSAVDQGIAVVLANAGQEVLERTGALSYVGAIGLVDAATEAGKRFKEAGVTSAACMNPAPGVPVLDQICNIFARALGGKSQIFPYETGDPTSTRAKVQALLQRGDIDGIFAEGVEGAEPALDALRATGKAGKVKLGNYILSPKVLDAIKRGDAMFAIDQQQWLQGYYPVQMITQYLRYGLVPPTEVSTGPTFVTKETVDKVIELSKQDIR